MRRLANEPGSTSVDAVNQVELFGRKINQRAAHDDPCVRNHCINPAHVRNCGIDDARAAIKAGQIDNCSGRAGADGILTYFARDAARLLAKA